MRTPCLWALMAMILGLCPAQGAQPVNDDFADRVRVIGLQLQLSGNNVDASAELDEPGPFFPRGSRSVWWEWTAPVTSQVRISTDGSSFDTQLAVFTGGALNQLNLERADDDGGSNLASEVELQAYAGTTYQIMVDGYLGATGAISLEIQQDVALKILSAPADRGALVGRDVTFGVSVSGPGTIRYQWWFEDAALAAATNNTLVLTNLQLDDTGDYTVRARNEFGSQVTATATLTVREGFDVAVFTNLTYVRGDSGSRAYNLRQSIDELGYRDVPFRDLVGIPPARVVVLPQIDYTPLTTNDLVVLKALVEDGGTLILPSGPSSWWYQTAALNEIMGWNLEIQYQWTFAQQTAAAIGTPFATVPVQLPANYQTGYLATNSLPPGATILYQSPGAAVVAVLPKGLGRVIWLGWDWTEARPWGSQDGGWIAALGAAIELGRTATLPDRPPLIALAPTGRTVAAGRPVTFRTIALGSEPLSYQWFHETNALAGATNATFGITATTVEQSGTYRVRVSNPFGQVESGPIQLSVYEPGPLEFRIESLGTEAVVVDHDALTGDDRGGIALTESRVFVTGDAGTAHFSSEDLTQGVRLNVLHDGMLSDLRTRNTYIFNLGNISQLQRLDPATGEPTSEVIALSQTIPVFGGYGMVFSGFGRAVIRSGSNGNAYEILLPSGTVIDHGYQPLDDFHTSDAWASWGVVEFFDGHLHLAYRANNGQRIVRRQLGTSTSEPIMNFDYLSDLSSFTVDPYRGRWYFHHEGGSQFGGIFETLGFAPADVSFALNVNQPPVLLSQPSSQVVISGQTAQFSTTAFGLGSLHYQWLRDDQPLANATNRLLVLTNVSLANNGSYRVVVTNAFGSTNSQPATLTVIDGATLFFQVHSLGSEAVTLEHSHITGDDRGGIAVSDSQVFVTGDAGSARFQLSNLGGGTGLGLVHDGLISDLRSQTTYVLGVSNVIWNQTIGQATSLIRLDSTTGLPTTEIIPLSRALPVAWGSQMFAGFGRFVLMSGADGRGYDVLLPSGTVLELGPLSLGDAHLAESWASWGVAEFHDNTLHLLYRHASYPWIVRRRLGEFNSTILAEFINLADLANFVVDSYSGRWYFNHQYTSQFGSGTQILGFAPAATSHYAATNQPPYILTPPAPQSADLGESVLFSVNSLGTPPLRHLWLFNDIPLANATNAQLALANVSLGQAGQYRVIVSNDFGAVTSAPALLQISGPLSSHFRIVSLGTNGVTIDHLGVTGDDRGGIALSSANVFVTGDQATGLFARNDLSGGFPANRVYDGLCSDLRSRKVYTLGFNSSPLVSGQVSANSLIALDGFSGHLTSEIILLSQAIPLGAASGVFSGYGRMVVRSAANGRAYDIALPSGFVTDLGAAPAEDANIFTESWAYWGVAEFFNNALHLVYRNHASQIVRRAVGTSSSSVIAGFNNLADLTSFTVDVELGRWLFHHEGASDLGSGQEVLGYAGAEFEITADPNRPPVISLQPASVRTFAGRTAHLWVSLAGGEPTFYQWYHNGIPRPSPVGPHLGLTNALPGDTGFYWIVVSNYQGSAISEPAFVLVQDDAVSPAVNVAYLRSVNEPAWGDFDNVAALDRVFGSNHWSEFTFESVDVPALFAITNDLVVIEGGANTADALETFLGHNQQLIEQWVAAGGSLFLNAAPSIGNGMALGFGGMQLHFPDYQSSAQLSAPSAPFATGPFLPVGASWSGTYAANATVTGPGLSPLLSGGTSGGIVAGEAPYGNGRIMFSTLTPPSFHQPGIEAQNLRANLLAHAARTPAVPEATVLNHFRMTSPGGDRLLLASAHQPGILVWLQSSTNLVNWHDVATNLVPPSGVLIVPVPVDAQARASFFRIWNPQ